MAVEFWAIRSRSHLIVKKVHHRLYGSACTAPTLANSAGS
nr:hypothetical protein Itr_chr03CG25460 [Ipomoea trifida]